MPNAAIKREKRLLASSAELTRYQRVNVISRDETIGL